MPGDASSVVAAAKPRSAQWFRAAAGAAAGGCRAEAQVPGAIAARISATEGNSLSTVGRALPGR
jgi:hypothetical protein